MFWMGMEHAGCPTCGGNVEKKDAATRKIYGETYYFDTGVREGLRRHREHLLPNQEEKILASYTPPA